MPDKQGSELPRILFRLFKVAVFLGVGTGIGFFLGLAYASHLYGTPPVVMEIQSWLAGDSLYQGPLPVDVRGNLMRSPVSIIPKVAACIGFGIAVSVLAGSMTLKACLTAIKKQKPGAVQGLPGKEMLDESSDEGMLDESSDEGMLDESSDEGMLE